MKMNLAEVYGALIQKRPDLAVYDLKPPQPYFPNWLLPNGREDDTPDDSIAQAMVLSKLLHALPDGHWVDHVGRFNCNGAGWRVWRPLIGGFDSEPVRDSPLEALVAFYLLA